MSYDTVIAAIGQRPKIPKQFNLTVGQGNIIQVDPDTLVTNREGAISAQPKLVPVKAKSLTKTLW